MKKYFIALAALTTVVSCAHKDEKQESTTTVVEAAAPTKAQAVIKASKNGKVKGLVHFTEENGVMTIETMVEGLKPGPHGFHIHAVGDCSAPDFSSAGGHFHVHSQMHASPTAANRHAGDLGNLVANNKGVAKSTIKIEGVSFKAGETNILGKSIVIHQDKDDFKSQPAGNSGARIGCGLIEAL